METEWYYSQMQMSLKTKHAIDTQSVRDGSTSVAECGGNDGRDTKDRAQI